MNKLIFTAVAGTLLGLACEKLTVDLDNPLDPDSPGYTPPEVNIVSGPAEGGVVTLPEVTFEWAGNELAVEYRYNFNNTGPNNGWSDWTDITSVRLDYLDEGDHRFRVQSRYASSDTSNSEAVNFVVDAVKGPALMFFPRRQITFQGSIVTFEILAEEVIDLTAAEFAITYDPDSLNVVSVTQGSLFKDKGESIFLSENNGGSGTLIISTALLGGTDPSVSGSGSLAIVQLQTSEKGTQNLGFGGSEVFKDPQNNRIEVVETVEGLVIVE